MNFETLYQQVKEKRLSGRYITLDFLAPLYQNFDSNSTVEIVGHSERGLPIHTLKLGRGSKKVLGWSQMHGNESTTTKALMDFMSYLTHNPSAETLLDTYTFCFIPLLNPDGALLYTRENANGIDLNRDAQDLSQSESRVLREVFNAFKPELCLNLHDQRTIYGLSNHLPATVSFLAPAADRDCTITDSREQAMTAIVRINEALQQIIPGQVGRYDDSYNPNCVGDTFQTLGIPTILFEAGHYPKDYQREHTRELIFRAFLALFEENLKESPKKTTIEGYFEIPENEKNYRDILLRNALIEGRSMDVAIQYEEQLREGQIEFVPKVDAFGELGTLHGHKEIDLKGSEILINSHENVFVDEKIVTIQDKSLKKPIII